MKIAVFGSGALGGYFGARLAAGGSEVHFLARLSSVTIIILATLPEPG